MAKSAERHRNAEQRQRKRHSQTLDDNAYFEMGNGSNAENINQTETILTLSRRRATFFVLVFSAIDLFTIDCFVPGDIFIYETFSQACKFDFGAIVIVYNF